ncbi:hypothetical protein GCM10023189_15100 [Nibrella saemangeumensis]|uniref:histidine kinase n=1 Tax=Nibrella saemangeumensis TaxID=1084526 RepID=A0ABP8MKE7_9BACT
MIKDFLSAALINPLFERAKHFIGLLDRETDQFIQVNPAGSDLFGCRDIAEFLQESGHNASCNPFGPGKLAQIKTALEQTSHYSEEREFPRKSGASFWGKLEVDPFEVNGRRYLLVQITDINHARSVERRLEQSSRQYEAVFTNATIGIVVCDKRGIMVSANQFAHNQFGYSPGELQGKSIDALVPYTVLHRHEELRESFNANPQVRAMGHGRDLYAKRKDDSVFPAEVSLSYFYQGSDLYVVSYILDITFKKEAERALIEQRNKIAQLNIELEQKVADRTHALMATLHQLEESKDELTKALAAERELGELKSRFVSMASHEFRTPLSAVLTSASLIEKYITTEQQDKRQKHIQRIKSSVNHLNDILEEFLSVGRLEEGRVEANWTTFDVTALISDVVTDMQGMLKPGQTIKTTLDCPRSVRLDKSLLRKIVINLLSNAIKYSGEDMRIEVTGRCSGTTTQLSIRDRGIGISEDDQKHLFERFFRAKNATNFQGTGLGLHIVAKYVELLNGTIELSSELNEGTLVTLTFHHENHPAH